MFDQSACHTPQRIALIGPSRSVEPKRLERKVPILAGELPRYTANEEEMMPRFLFCVLLSVSEAANLGFPVHEYASCISGDPKSMERARVHEGKGALESGWGEGGGGGEVFRAARALACVATSRVLPV